MEYVRVSFIDCKIANFFHFFLFKQFYICKRTRTERTYIFDFESWCQVITTSSSLFLSISDWECDKLVSEITA